MGRTEWQGAVAALSTAPLPRQINATMRQIGKPKPAF